MIHFPSSAALTNEGELKNIKKIANCWQISSHYYSFSLLSRRSTHTKKEINWTQKWIELRANRGGNGREEKSSPMWHDRAHALTHDPTRQTYARSIHNAEIQKNPISLFFCSAKVHDKRHVTWGGKKNEKFFLGGDGMKKKTEEKLQKRRPSSVRFFRFRLTWTTSRLILNTLIEWGGIGSLEAGRTKCVVSRGKNLFLSVEMKRWTSIKKKFRTSKNGQSPTGKMTGPKYRTVKWGLHVFCIIFFKKRKWLGSSGESFFFSGLPQTRRHSGGNGRWAHEGSVSYFVCRLPHRLAKTLLPVSIIRSPTSSTIHRLDVQYRLFM